MCQRRGESEVIPPASLVRVIPGLFKNIKPFLLRTFTLCGHHDSVTLEVESKSIAMFTAFLKLSLKKNEVGGCQEREQLS